VKNLDENKPLSADELLKLLDTTSKNSNEVEQMDDFEKEALEGFAAHSNSLKAEVLINELNLSISKKIDDANKGGSKNKIIWFSAAATIILIIIISIFFLNQTKNDSETNIVLNETKNNDKPKPQLEAVEEDTVSFEKDKVEEKAKSQDLIMSKNGKSEVVNGSVSESAIALSENQQGSSESVIFSKDISKNKNDEDLAALAQKAVALDDKSEFKKKEKSNNGQLESGSVSVANKNSSSAIDAIDETDKSYKKLGEESDSKNAIKSETVLEKSTKFENANSVVSTKSAAIPATSGMTSNENTKPSYTGNELAIKEYILSYFKSKQIVKPIFGSFKIVGNVNLKGELTVSEIIQIKEKECSCKEEIKKALNTMKKWNTAKQNGNAISSSVEFTLIF
jgi:hypothetical protein